MVETDGFFELKNFRHLAGLQLVKVDYVESLFQYLREWFEHRPRWSFNI